MFTSFTSSCQRMLACRHLQLWIHLCISASFPKVPPSTGQSNRSVTHLFPKSSLGSLTDPDNLLGMQHTSGEAAHKTHAYFLPVALNANSLDLHFREKTRGIPSGFLWPEIRQRRCAVSWREEVKYCFLTTVLRKKRKAAKTATHCDLISFVFFF